MSESDSNPTPEDKKADTSAEAAGTPQTDENGPVNADHMDNDLDLPMVKKFIILSFGVTFAVFILMLLLLRGLDSGFKKDRGEATAESRQIPSKENALLQTQPYKDKAEYDKLENTRLNMTTNAVEHAVVPVEQAKSIMLEEDGFPVAKRSSQDNSQLAMSRKPSKAAPAPKNNRSPSKTAAHPTVDPRLVARGKKLYETNCTTCHKTGKGGIGPNILKGYGTMRKLEGREPILMDEAYIINSMNNPTEHIAKGYPPVMMNFKKRIKQADKEAIAAYLKSMGTPIEKEEPAQAIQQTAKPGPTPAPVSKEGRAAQPEPAATPEPSSMPEAEPKEEPEAAPKAPEQKTPAPKQEKPETPSGIIFV